MSTYHVYKEPDASDILASLLVTLVIIGIIIMLFVYIGAIILGIFLGIGALIGFVYAMVVYIKAFIDACKSVGGVKGKSGFSSFLRKWLHLIGTASLNAFKNNFSAAHNAIIRAGAYKFLSFRKWMWIIVAPSVLIFGTAMIVFVIMLQISIALSIVALILMLILAALLVYILVGIIYSVGKVSAAEGTAISYNNPFATMSFSRYFTFSELLSFPKDYYKTVFAAIGSMWQTIVSSFVTNTASAKGFGYLSIARYFFFVSSIVMIPMTAIFIAVTFILLSVIFPVLFIVEFFWALIALILK